MYYTGVGKIYSQNYVGKKVSQVEKELKGRPAYSPVILGVVLVLILLVLVLSVKFISLRGELATIGAEAESLRKENTALKIELTTLQSSPIKAVEQEKAPEAKTEQGRIIYHHIQSGDSLPRISSKYYGTEIFGRQLANLNGISQNTLLQPGQVLQVPREPDPSWGN